MRRLAFLAVLALSSSCGRHQTGGPLDYLYACSPGASMYGCVQMLKHAPSNMFPAGRLESMDAHVKLIDDAQGSVVSYGPATHFVFAYTFYFNVGRDDVVALLTKNLDDRMGQGIAPTRTFAKYEGDYWRSEDGFWICGDHALTWISNPIRDEKDYAADETSARVDHYVQRWPKTATLWEMVGRLLIGFDTAPRPPPHEPPTAH